jgi:hypothetical protein
MNTKCECDCKCKEVTKEKIEEVLLKHLDSNLSSEVARRLIAEEILG